VRQPSAALRKQRFRNKTEGSTIGVNKQSRSSVQVRTSTVVGLGKNKTPSKPTGTRNKPTRVHRDRLKLNRGTRNCRNGTRPPPPQILRNKSKNMTILEDTPILQPYGNRQMSFTTFRIPPLRPTPYGRRTYRSKYDAPCRGTDVGNWFRCRKCLTECDPKPTCST
jgi:hypothetical protein